MEAKESTRTRIGFSRMEKKYEWKDHVIFMGILLAMAVWVNRGIEIKGLYMDDLYFWSCYGEQSFLQYVFPVGSTRLRAVFTSSKEKSSSTRRVSKDSQRLSNPREMGMAKVV